MAQKDLNVILGLDTENFLKGIKRTERQLQRFSRQMQNIGRDMTQMITLPLGLAAGSAIKAAADFEQLETSFSVLLGSAEEGAAIFKDLQQFSASTPFQLTDIANAAKQLIAFGFSADQAKSSLQFLGDVSAGSGNQIGELAQIFGQVAGAGKLTAERLNQLQERAVPISAALAQTMGVAETSIRDLVSAGKVSFADFEAAFQSLAAEGGLFAGGMEKQSKTLAGVFSTFRDNVALALGEVGKTIVELFNLREVMVGVTGAIQNAVKWFQGLDNRTKKIIISIGAAAAAMGPLLIVIGKAASIATLFTAGFKNMVLATNALKVALGGLALNPIVLGIAAVAGALVLAYKYSNTFRDAVQGAFRAAGVVVDWLKERFGAFIDTIRNLGGLFVDMGKIILSAAKTYFGGIARIAGPILQALAERFGGLGDVIKNIFKVSLMVAIGFVRGMGNAFNELISIVREGVGAFVDAFEALKEGDVRGAFEAFKEGLKKGNPIGIALTQGGRLAQTFKDGFAQGVTDTDQLFSDMKAAYDGGLKKTVDNIEVPEIKVPITTTSTPTTPAGAAPDTGSAAESVTGVKNALLSAATAAGQYASAFTTAQEGVLTSATTTGAQVNAVTTMLAEGYTLLGEKITFVSEAMAQKAERIMNMTAAAQELGVTVDAIGEQFMASFGEAATAGINMMADSLRDGIGSAKDLATTVARTTLSIVRNFIQQGVAAAVANALKNPAGIIPPVGLALAAAAGAAASGLFTSLVRAIGIPALAEGGIVTQPTLALIGERGPEAVVPLNDGIMGGATVNIAGEFVLRGEDLLLAVERADRRQNRVR